MSDLFVKKSTTKNALNRLSVRDSKILVVDDSDFSRVIIAEVLQKGGFSNLEFAINGQDALEKTREFEPDLVLLDLLMPEMDGFEYCKRIRSQPKFNNMQIIVQSGSESPEDLAKAFSLGANDYVSKPINAEEVILRIIVHLENYHLMMGLEEYRARTELDLSNAREMQNTIMPSEAIISEIKSNYQIEIAAHFEPSSEIGGDFWGMKPLSHDELAIYSIDFSGHGVTAALNTFRLHTILQDSKNFFSDPALFLYKTNNKLKELLSSGSFATMFYGVINLSENKIFYSSAGSTTPFIRRDNSEIVALKPNGIPLGALKNSTYDSHEVEFSKNDILLLYSDALIETENEAGDFLSDSELVDFLKKSDNKDTEVILSSLLKIYYKHCKGVEKTDDLTINVYRRI